MNKLILFLTCFALLFVGCGKDDVASPDTDTNTDTDTSQDPSTEGEETKLRVDVTIDWDNLTKSPQGATIIFYPREGSTMSGAQYVLTNNSQDYIELGLGVYDVIVFNETMDSYNQISFEGQESYKTFSAYWNVSSGVVEDSNESLYVDRLVDLVINQTMIDKQEPLSITFTPSSATTLMDFVFNVEQLSNVSENSSSFMTLTGLASGYNFSTGCPTGESISHKTTLTDREYTSNGDGKMKCQFYVFGKAADITKATPANELALQFALKNNETLIVDPIDVTAVIEKLISTPQEATQPNESLSSESEEQSTQPESQTGSTSTTTSDVKLEVGGTPESGVEGDIDGDGIRDLPDETETSIVVPQVPDYESSGGFSSTTDQWSDPIIIPII